MSIDPRPGERDICYIELQTQQPGTVYVFHIFDKPRRICGNNRYQFLYLGKVKTSLIKINE